MPRTLSSTLRAAVHAPRTGEDVVALLTISHPSITTIRLARSMRDVVSRGNTFRAYPFDVDFPEETDERPVEVSVVIDNVLHEITDAITDLPSAPTMLIEGVLASSPDTVEHPGITATFRNARANALVVQGTLGLERLLEEQYPGDTFNPRDWPAIF